jgi:flagellar basal body-associated protein FliL
MKKIKWLLIVIILAVIAGYFYIKEASKENDPTQSKDSIVISVDDLCKLFVNYEDSANALYLSKVIDLKRRHIEY